MHLSIDPYLIRVSVRLFEVIRVRYLFYDTYLEFQRTVPVHIYIVQPMMNYQENKLQIKHQRYLFPPLSYTNINHVFVT